MKFRDRAEAGRLLALRLGAFKGRDAIVLAIPMGGIPVAYEIARELKAPLDVIMVKKIGAPFNPELAIGAVAWNGAVLVDEEMVQKWQIPREYIREESQKLVKEMNDRLAGLRVGLGNFPKLFGRTVIIVDDGIATGSTMMAAVEVVRDQGAEEVAIAVPVLPRELVETMELVAPLYYLEAPEDFEAVGQYYEQFEMVSRETAVELMLLANVA
jgi:putative phosphoribosyl transferase